MSDWPDWVGDWTPTVERQPTTVASPPVAGLAAMLDIDPAVADLGAPLPPLWHWVALSAWPLGSTVGPDGHPVTGSFMPPTPYPRRMWLGATLEITTPPPIGTEVVIERTVTEVVEKTGSGGRFAIVTVTTDVRSPADAVLLLERNQFAYRSPSPDPTPPPARPAAHGANNPWFARRDDGWQVTPDPVMLMRFSALTANGHRIHYDVPYVTDVEGYPNLLVHGPLMATLLAEAVRRDQPDREISGFRCRAQRPFFLGTSAMIRSTTNGDAVTLELREDAPDDDGGAFMTAEATLR